MMRAENIHKVIVQSYINRNNVGRSVFHRNSSVHETLPQIADIGLMNSPEFASFVRSQNSYGSQRSAKDGWRKGCRKDESRSITSHHVDKILTPGNVTSNVSERFACTI